MPDPQSFQFSFLNTERLLLCDKYGEQIQLFPDTTSLARFKQSPLKATPINVSNGSILGFLIENNCGREINLTQHYLRNERATFNKQITNKKLANNGKFRILTDTDDKQDDVQIYTNDIVVSFEALNGNTDDKLLLVDGYNNQFVLYTFTASKRKILNLCELPPDILCHIILFGDIEDYMFGIIQTSKRMHQGYSPYNKPFIIKQLIYNQGTSDLLGIPFLTNEQWVQWQLFGTPELSFKKSELIARGKFSALESYRIAGSYAWTNYRRLPISENDKQHYLKMIENKKHSESLSLSSSLYLLHFVQLCKYGGIKNTFQLKQLFLQIVSSYEGALGARIMLYYYIKQVLLDKINRESNINVDLKTGEISPKRRGRISDHIKDIKDILSEMYHSQQQDVLFEFVDILFKWEKLQQFSWELSKDPFSITQISCDINNMIRSIIRKVYQYHKDLIQCDNFMPNDNYDNVMWMGLRFVIQEMKYPHRTGWKFR